LNFKPSPFKWGEFERGASPSHYSYPLPFINTQGKGARRIGHTQIPPLKQKEAYLHASFNYPSNTNPEAGQAIK
jgi:hypothetical protein